MTVVIGFILAAFACLFIHTVLECRYSKALEGYAASSRMTNVVQHLIICRMGELADRHGLIQKLATDPDSFTEDEKETLNVVTTIQSRYGENPFGGPFAFGRGDTV